MLQRLQSYDFHDVQDMGLPLDVGGSQAKGIVLHVAPDDEMSVRKYLLEQQIEATKMSLGDWPLWTVFACYSWIRRLRCQPNQ